MIQCTRNLYSNLLFFIFANAQVMFGFMVFHMKKELVLDDAAAPEDKNECTNIRNKKFSKKG